MTTAKQRTFIGELKTLLLEWENSKDLYNPNYHSTRQDWSEKICKNYSLDAKYSEELTKAINSLLKIVKLI